jgi:hypothetical protein
MAFSPNGFQLGYWMGASFDPSSGEAHIQASYITHGDQFDSIADGFIMPTGWSKEVGSVWYVNNNCTGAAFSAIGTVNVSNWLYAGAGGQLYASAGTSSNVALQSFQAGPSGPCTLENLSGNALALKVVGLVGPTTVTGPISVVVQ